MLSKIDYNLWYQTELNWGTLVMRSTLDPRRVVSLNMALSVFLEYMIEENEKDFWSIKKIWTIWL